MSLASFRIILSSVVSTAMPGSAGAPGIDRLGMVSVFPDRSLRWALESDEVMDEEYSRGDPAHASRQHVGDTVKNERSLTVRIDWGQRVNDQQYQDCRWVYNKR